MHLEQTMADRREVSFFPHSVSIMSARSKKSVSLASGMRYVTVTPASFSSARRTNENESTNAFVPLQTAWYVPGMKPAMDPVSRMRPWARFGIVRPTVAPGASCR